MPTRNLNAAVIFTEISEKVRSASFRRNELKAASLRLALTLLAAMMLKN